MQSIAIISLNTHTYFHNYGAILHSYAFQRFLEKNVIDSIILDYIPPALEGWNLDAPWKSLLARRDKHFCKYILLCYPYRIRKNKIDTFIKTKMKLTHKVYTKETLKREDLHYDTIICESDVIWSNGFWDESYFLALDNMQKMKKIAYSPSMADCNLSSEKVEKLSDYLGAIDYISGRESYECEFLRRFTNKPIAHVCDPVFLLNEEDYSEIVANRVIQEDYVLLYLPADNNKYLRKCAEEYAKRHSFKIIEIDSRLSIKITHKCIITAGIEEFLSLIKYSKACFTNSFHAVCFSIIFRKEFYAFSRITRGKVEDVLSKLKLKERFIENDFTEKAPINYAQVINHLEIWKRESKEWILNAIAE